VAAEEAEMQHELIIPGLDERPYDDMDLAETLPDYTDVHEALEGMATAEPQSPQSPEGFVSYHYYYMHGSIIRHLVA
jgi:hypothetical protein